MDKLFEVDLGSAVTDVFKANFVNALKGESDTFFYNYDCYLTACPVLLNMCKVNGARAISNLIATHKLKVKSDVVENLSDMYCALYSKLETAVFSCTDTEDEEFKSVLVTRNMRWLEYLKCNGMLSDDTDMTKIEDAMTGNKTALGFADETFCVIRLELSAVVDGLRIFKASIPRSRFPIGLGKKYFIIPTDFLYLANDALLDIFKDTPFTFEKSTSSGVVSSKVTVNPNIVSHFYTDCADNDIISKLRKVKSGFDIGRLMFMMYDLEAPVTDIGAASFRFEMLNSIREIHLSDIDKSRHNTSYTDMRGIFKTRVKGFKLSDYGDFTAIDTSTGATRADKEEIIMRQADTMSDKDLYNLMNCNPALFGDLKDALEKRAKLTPKFIKAMRLVDLYTDKARKIEQVTKMLQSGIVKILLYSKKNRLYEVICSNNPLVLDKMLGKAFMSNFESPQHKLKDILAKVTSGDIRTSMDLENVIVEYNVVSHILDATPDANIQNLIRGTKEPKIDEALLVLNAAIDLLKSKQTVLKEGMIRYKDVYAEDAKTLYGIVNVDNIVSIEYCGVKPKEPKV